MSYLDNVFGLFTENKKYSDNKKKNHLNEWSGGRDYSNKIQTSCELPKGKMADDFKRYLKTNNILYEPSEAWNNIHFSVFFDTQEDIDKANAFIDTLDESCGGKDKKADKKKIKVKEDIDSADTIRVLIVEPGKAPRVENISQSLESLQRIVDGYIEVIYPFDDNVCLICNEEGKIEGLPYNRPLYGDDGQLYDVIAGTFIVAGLGAEDFASLSDNLIKKYSDIFSEPLHEVGRFESVKGKKRRKVQEKYGYVKTYKGCKIHEFYDCYVVTDKYGSTIYQTRWGIPVIEAWIDEMTENGLLKKYKSKNKPLSVGDVIRIITPSKYSGAEGTVLDVYKSATGDSVSGTWGSYNIFPMTDEYEIIGHKDSVTESKKRKVKEGRLPTDPNWEEWVKEYVAKNLGITSEQEAIDEVNSITNGYITVEIVYLMHDRSVYNAWNDCRLSIYKYRGDSWYLEDGEIGNGVFNKIKNFMKKTFPDLKYPYEDFDNKRLPGGGIGESCGNKNKDNKKGKKMTKRKSVKESQIIDAPDHYYNYHEGDEEDEKMYDRVYRRLLPLVDDFDIDYDFLKTDKVDEIIKKLIRLIKLQHPMSLFAEDDGSYIDMYEGESVKGKTEAKKSVKEGKKPLKEKTDTEFLKELKAEKEKRLANVKSLANMTKDELWQLRNEIKLGSLYTRDYENEFGIDPSYVQSTFDGFLEYVEDEMRNDIPDYDDNDFWELLDNYDTPELLDEYCNYMLEWSDEDIKNMTKEARQEIEDWYQDELYYANMSDVEDAFGADTLGESRKPVRTGTVKEKERYTQSELKQLVKQGLATDITNVEVTSDMYNLEKVGVSFGINGMNGALLKNKKTGEYYVITARNTNLFRLV